MDARVFAQTFETRCPFLGLSEDRKTAFGYPDKRNLCHRHDLAVPLTRDRQAGYCLSENHENCSIYLQRQLPDEFPEKTFIWRKWPSRLLLLLPLVLIIIAALLWWPAPGTSIEEFIGSAAPAQNTVSEKVNSQPPLSQKIIVTKVKASSTPVGSSTAVTSTPTPSSESTSQENKPAEGGAGGFLIHIYD